jgi:hypothetical protein
MTTVFARPGSIRPLASVEVLQLDVSPSLCAAYRDPQHDRGSHSARRANTSGWASSLSGLVNIEHGCGAFVRNPPRLRRVSHNRYAQSRQPHAHRSKPMSAPRQSHRHRFPSRDRRGRLRLCPTTHPVRRRRQPRRLSTSYFLLDLAQETDLADHDLSPNGFFQYVEHLTGRLAARWPN